MAPQVCGRCKGKLEYAGPSEQAGGDGKGGAVGRRGGGAGGPFAQFVASRYQDCKRDLQVRSQRDKCMT